jgi:glutathione synthase/RimK-type ligase-like ATP-grasp enzyme
MTIAIHHNPGSFSDRWISYCKENNIQFKIVNCYDNDIINQLKDCDALMWHHSNYDYRDALFAKQLIYSLQTKCIKVFPDFNTTWHFDDKVGQKYLLEAIEAPLVPSFVFYNKKEALNWANNTIYPKVFKLRGGSGSWNVRLVKSKRQARSMINIAFGRGFPQYNRSKILLDRTKKFIAGKDSFKGLVASFVRLFTSIEYDRMIGREKGYIYFQEFIRGNSFDTRVIVVDGKALAERRFVRKNDFRASGSGAFSYEDINTDAIKIALSISKKLNVQSIAFDFVLDENNKPLIIETSYGFGTKGIHNAPGYWDSCLNWHEGKVYPEDWMIDTLLK